MSPEMEYLKELWDKQEWGKLLDATKQLLMAGGRTVEELAHLNYYACRARFAHADFYAGLPSGELARRLAEDTQAWDLLGSILITLSAGYHWMMQYERSLEHAFAFLERIPVFSTVKDREGEAWIRVGMAYEGLGLPREALLAYQRAFRILKEARRWYWALIATKLTIKLLYSEDPTAVPGMLWEQMRLRRQAPHDRAMGAIIRLDRARYALFRQDFPRCLRLTAQCAQYAPVADQVLEAHLLSAQCYKEMGDYEQAMRYAHLARGVALAERFYAQEYEVVELIYTLMKAQGQVSPRPAESPETGGQAIITTPWHENRNDLA